MNISATELLAKLVIPWSSAPLVPVHYVTDNDRWSSYWDAEYITRGLRDAVGIDAETVQKPWRLRGTIVHFGDRDCFLDGPSERLAKKNTLFLTWSHGQHQDPAMAPLFEQLRRRQDQLERIVTTCSLSKSELIEAGIEDQRILTLPTGVDLTRFRPCGVDRKLAIRRELGIPRDALCIGSFQKDSSGDQGLEPKLVKGPDVLLETIGHLAKEFNNLFVLLTGPARGYLKKGLDQLRVPYLHRCLREYWDLVPYYQALDLYLIASRCEAGPKALLESWAVGVPLASTRMGMPADWVRDGENGGLAEVDDAAGLAACAAELCQNADFRHRCRRQAWQDVQAFGWTAVARQYYEQLYAPHLGRIQAA